MKTALARITAAAALAAGAALACAARETVSLDGEWKFAKDPRPGAPRDLRRIDTEGLAWTDVRVPHDWAIHGPSLPQDDSRTINGATGRRHWKGVGWYSRSFTLPQGADGSRVFLEFDGVMARPEVFVNGKFVGGWDYGYASFAVDATDAAKFGGENELVVRCDTRDHSSRWYPGAGIYRSARLVVKDKVHFPRNGVFVKTKRLDGGAGRDRWQVDVEAEIAGGYSGKVVFMISGLGKEARRNVLARDGRARATYEVPSPRLWSPDDPALYTLAVQIPGHDEERVRFGFRTAEWTADDGFHLNGKRLQLKGVNLHSDLGPLGMAFNLSAARRQLATMKDMGANAFRTSHNPPDPKMLDLCDELGIVVWDECFDKWDATAGIRKDEDMEEYVARNLKEFVRRDRNHPSVVMWSIGNELHPKEEKNPSGMTVERHEKFKAAVLACDPTRAVGMGCYLPHTVDSGLYDPFDVTGWNYAEKYWPMRHRRPDKSLVYSESCSSFSTAGFYTEHVPSNKMDYCHSLAAVNSYDYSSANYSDIPDWEFWRMERDRFVAGEFVWTGIDYLGEPAPFWNESRSAYFGICDLMSMPKDRFYLYRAHWNKNAETTHLLPHWTWPGREGKDVLVIGYTSGDGGELFLNGKSLGRRTFDRKPTSYSHENYYDVCNRYRLTWKVPYEPGELKLVSYRDGKTVGTDAVRTAGRPAAVRLTPESAALPADGDGVVFVKVEVVDEKGVPCPTATDSVTFEVSGPGEFVAGGNASEHETTAFDSKTQPLFFGRAAAVVRRAKGSTGKVVLKATAPGLAPAEVSFR